MAKKVGNGMVVLELKGLDRFIERFNVTASTLLPAMGEALYNQALAIGKEADLLVPYDSGALARSQIIHDAAYQGQFVYVDITYGGPAGGLDQPYAEIQHENMDFNHPSLASGLPANGRQAKYLEDPVDQAVAEGKLSDILAWRIESILLNRMNL
jgi:hypothetical protein